MLTYHSVIKVSEERVDLCGGKGSGKLCTTKSRMAAGAAKFRRGQVWLMRFSWERAETQLCLFIANRLGLSYLFKLARTKYGLW